MRRIFGPLPDPPANEILFTTAQRRSSIGRRHPLVLTGGNDSLKEQAFVRLAAHDHSPPVTTIGAILYSFARTNPAIELTSLGMPRCYRHLDPQATFLFFPTGSTHNIAFTTPNLLWLAGSHVYAQAATFSSGFNSLGIISSNGGDMLLNVN